MQQIILLKNAMVHYWVNRFEASTWCRFTLASIFFMLAACGGSGGNPQSDPNKFVSAQPVSVQFRPGEAEQAKLTASDAASLAGAKTKFFFADTVTETSQQACANPDTACGIVNFTGNADAPVHGMEVFELLPSDTLGVSTLPLIAFADSVVTATPVIRFAASASGDIEDPLNNNVFFDEDIGHSLAVAADGTVWAWGENSAGQLGDNSRLSRAIPVQVKSTETFTEVAAGKQHSLAIATNGTVWSWGIVAPELLGDSNNMDQLTPVLVQGISDVAAIAAGGLNSIALRNDGTVWTWKAIQGSVPEQVNLSQSAIAVAAGTNHALVLLADRTIVAWGNNSLGQLGKGSTQSSFPSNPSVVTNIPWPVLGIAAGPGYSVAVLADEKVRTWGLNNAGQLGYSATDKCQNKNFGNICSYTPQLVSGLDEVTNVAAGGRFVVARRTDGSVWAWGDNRFGQLGGLPGLSRLTPQPVQGLSNVLDIRAGRRFALAMSSDQACDVGDGRVGGRLLAWGNNLLGARGDGTAVNWLRPTPVLTLGDSAQCESVMGNRLIVYKSGTGTGTIESNQAGLTCTGNICWQALTPNSSVMLTATPGTNSNFGDWRWDCPSAVPMTTLTMDSVKHCKVVFNETVPAVACADGIDNDGDGLVDLADPGCESAIDDSEVDAPPAAACADGIDNDSDGLIDLNDPGCTDASDDSEQNSTGGTSTLTVTILGGPGAGQVNSSDTLIPTLQCINSNEVQTTCSADFPTGNRVFLVPSPFSGNTSVTWQGCDSDFGIEGCQLDMTGDRSVSATFM